MKKNSVTKIGLLTAIVFITLWTPNLANGQPVYTIPTPELIGIQSAVPVAPTNISAGVVGVGGPAIYYYWVVAVYTGGSVPGPGPVRVANAPNPTAGGNFVQISWTGVPGVGVTYDVLKTATPVFDAACAACLLATGGAATTVLDNAGAIPGPYTLANPPAIRAGATMAINNRDYLTPTVVFTVPAGGSYRWQGTAATPSFIDGPFLVSGPALATLNLSALTGSVQGVGSRISADFATITGLKGADFRATSTGGAAGTLIGVQASATMAAGTGTLDEVYGANFNAFINFGTLLNAYGVVGNLTIAATATAPAVTQYALGVLGSFDNQLPALAAYASASIMGVVQDNDTPGPTGVFVALLNGDTTRTAANPVPAAFKVIDRHSSHVGVNFDYGLDMYWNNAPERTTFNIADIRGASGDMLINAVAVPGVWSITRGAGNLTGLQLQAVTHVNLNAWAAANGTIAYCSNCDPAVAGAGPTACTTGGASTGTVAFRLNGAWTCLGI